MKPRVMLALALAVPALLGVATADHEPGPVFFTQLIEPGFDASLYAVGAVPATTMAFGPDGRLYVATYQGTVIRFSNGGGIEVPSEVVVSGLDSPISMTFGPDGLLYVTSSDPDGPDLSRPWGMVTAHDVDAGPTVAGTRVLYDVPTGIHTLAGVGFGPDGKMYVGVASSTLDGYDTPGEAPEFPLITLSILRMDVADAPVSALDHYTLDGNAPLDTVATGIHNAHDIAFRGADLFTASNGPQSQEPLGEDHLVRVADAPSKSFLGGTGVDIGTPGCLWTHDALGWPVSGVSDYPIDASVRTCDGVTQIAAALGLHKGSTGLAVAPPDFGPHGGDVFVAEWGNLPVGEPKISGHKIVRVGLSADGSTATAEDGGPDIEDFLVTSAPIDVVFHGGAMYVADFGTGAVLRVVPA